MWKPFPRVGGDAETPSVYGAHVQTPRFYASGADVKPLSYLFCGHPFFVFFFAGVETAFHFFWLRPMYDFRQAVLMRAKHQAYLMRGLSGLGPG